MALARTCRTLRAVYYTAPPAGNTYAAFSSPVWAALVAQRPFEGQGRPAILYGAGLFFSTSTEKEKRLKHLWSDRFDETKMVVLGSKRTPERRKWDRALQMHVVHPAKHEKMLIRSEEWTDAIADVAKQVRCRGILIVEPLQSPLIADVQRYHMGRTAHHQDDRQTELQAQRRPVSSFLTSFSP